MGNDDPTDRFFDMDSFQLGRAAADLNDVQADVRRMVVAFLTDDLGPGSDHSYASAEDKLNDRLRKIREDALEEIARRWD